MCGHVGVIGNIFANEKKAFNILLHLDYLRGPHSTGIGIVYDDNKTEVLKTVGEPANIKIKYGDKFDDDGNLKGQIKALIGHNRYATVGRKIDENAHPFEHGHILGAHNGTLSINSALDKEDKFEVDSEAIFYNISQIGLRDTISKMAGAWALVFWDGKEKTLNWLRNNERPLVYTRSHDCLFWASEAWMLEVALNKCNIRHDKIQTFDENEHHYMELATRSITKATLYYDGKPMEGKKTVNFSYGKGIGGNVGSWPSFQPVERYIPGPVDMVNKPTTSTSVPNKSFLSTDKKDYKELIGKEIEFEVLGENENRHGMQYLLCHSAELPLAVELRIFAMGHKRYKEWQNSTGFYRGKVRNVVAEERPNGIIRYYAIPEYREISEEIKDITLSHALRDKPQEQKSQSQIILGKELDWDIEATYPGYMGERLTYTQYMQATKSGCSECGSEVTNKEVDTVIWQGPKSFVCSMCADRMTTENILFFNRQNRGA